MVLEASYSPLVAYERNGGVGRRWTEVALRDGVATVPIRGPMPPTFRVRLDGYDGGPLGVDAPRAPRPRPRRHRWPSRCSRRSARSWRRAPGCPASAVRSTVALEAPVPGDVLVQAAPGETVGRGTGRRRPHRPCRAARCCARSGSPATVAARSARSTSRRPGSSVRPTRPHPSPPGCRRSAADVSRFLVVAPGAARAQLVGSVVQHLPGLRGHRAARRHRGARGRGRAAGRGLPAGHLGPATADGSAGGTTLFRRRDPRDLWRCAERGRGERTERPLRRADGVSGPGSRPRRQRQRRPRGRGTHPGRSA